MKKLFISAVVALTLATSAFATEGTKVDFITLNNFQSEFSKASDVQWTTGKGYSKATFVINNERMEAFYDNAGEMIGTSKTASVEQLPVNAKRTFAKKLEGYTVKEAIRFEGNDEAAYYISAENEKGSVILKVTDEGAVSVKKI